jgi:hypothetical protein
MLEASLDLLRLSSQLQTRTTPSIRLCLGRALSTSSTPPSPTPHPPREAARRGWGSGNCESVRPSLHLFDLRSSFDTMRSQTTNKSASHTFVTVARIVLKYLPHARERPRLDAVLLLGRAGLQVVIWHAHCGGDAPDGVLWTRRRACRVTRRSFRISSASEIMVGTCDTRSATPL